MKNVTLISLIFLYSFSFAQKPKDGFSIDKHVEKHTQDFNEIFTPLYATKDTAQYNELLTKSHNANFFLGEIIALNLLGTYYRDQSNYKKSIQLHKKALAYAKEKDILDGLLYSNNMLGVVFRRMDDVKRGLAYHFKALELAKKSEKNDFTRQNTAIALNGIGNAYLILEEYESAKNTFMQSFDIEKSTNNKLGLAINHQNIGYTYERTHALDSALHHYKLSLKENIDIESELGKMICYNSISNVLLKQDKANQALKYINLAEKIALDRGDNFYTASSDFIKGKVLFKLNRLPEAKKYLDKSLTLSKKHNLKSNLADTHKFLSKYYEVKGDYKNALLSSQESNRVEYDYLNEKNIRFKNNLEISHETEIKTNKILDLKKEKEQFENTILYLLILLGIFTLLGILFYQREKLAKEKRVLEMEQKVLRAQMNPHFTFNALNSIKASIISEDTEKAVKYLNKFSKLIRNILYTSDKKTISLQEELNALESYVSIEELRVNGDINLLFDIKDVNPKDIKIPPLILQPYVENSIWHGLAPKKGDKEIKIEIYKRNKNRISINIIDNGIGRDAAEKNKVNKNHKSMGTIISQKRLNHFFNIDKNECIVKYTDLKDDHGTAIGTKVTLCICA